MNLIRKIRCWLRLAPHEYETVVFQHLYVEGNSREGLTKLGDWQEDKITVCKYCGRKRQYEIRD